MHNEKVGTVVFPAYSGVNVNMMPFIMGDIDSIPPEYQQYAEMISACSVREDEIGRIGYLSISESEVASGATQRRPGLHTEGTDAGDGLSCHGGDSSSDHGRGGYSGEPTKKKKEKKKAKRFGGVYMASNVDDSCVVYDMSVRVPGRHGDCEHLKEDPLVKASKKTLMKSGELFWVTDRCLHEALPVQQNVRRQWFRLVAGNLGMWYSKHNTPNRLGIKAPCLIVDDSKF